ncbi:MAG: tetratricopeptide repeat protein, partial [Alphaproteobacteria bacterium]|nr:tetratricopeptide repeat protein [Alphaproteobacteria bacterium]
MLGRRDPTRLSPILAEAVEARVLAGELKIMQLMPADAVRFYREAVAMVPPDNPGLIIRTLDSWGAAAAIPDAGAAAPPWQRALELRESMLGAGHRETMTARDRLIGLFLDTGQTAAARALLEKSLAAEQQSSTPADEALTRRLGQLGLLLRDQGALADAPTWLQRALERLVKESDVAPIRLARDFGDLAAVRRALGDVAAAGQFQGRALEQFRRALGAQHPDLGPQLDIMAEIELAGGNGIAALDHLKEAEAIARTRFGDWHVRIAERLYAIGRMLRALGQIAEAETVLKQGLSMHEAIQGQDSAELIFG